MKAIDREGVRFCYDEIGEDRDGTIIVLHDGCGIGDHRAQESLAGERTSLFRRSDGG
jgi:hypothetical protein